MLTTVATDGSLVSRPMGVQAVDFDGDLWFFAAADSHKVAEIARDSAANAAFSGSTSWVSVSGRASLVRDRDKIRELWNTVADAWFPDGPDTPGVVLIRLHADSAEYWDSPAAASRRSSAWSRRRSPGRATTAGRTRPSSCDACRPDAAGPAGPAARWPGERHPRDRVHPARHPRHRPRARGAARLGRRRGPAPPHAVRARARRPRAAPRRPPLLVFLQGGPGGKGPRPTGPDGWVGTALATHRVVLLDQRGTGRSSAVRGAALAARGPGRSRPSTSPASGRTRSSPTPSTCAGRCTAVGGGRRSASPTAASSR